MNRASFIGYPDPGGGIPEQAGHAHHHDQIHVPRPVIWLTAALISFTIVSILVARVTETGLTREGALSAVRETSFIASGQGYIGDPDPAPLVASRRDGQRIVLADAGEEVFPRLILRGIASKRASAGIDPATPIRLIETRDGQRLLIDDATGQVVRLSAFGPENGVSFDTVLEGARP